MLNNMPSTPNFGYEINRMSSQYSQAYEEGFNAAKRQFLEQLTAARETMKSTKAFETFTSTIGHVE